MTNETPSYLHGYHDGVSYGKSQPDKVILNEIVRENFEVSNNEDYAQGFADGARFGFAGTEI